MALVLFLGLWIVNYRTPEMREEKEAASRTEIAPGVAANMLLLVPLVIALALVVLGVFPDQEAALYLTAVALGLFMGALTLLMLVFS